ncbi:hypothetical protein FQV27_00825 [Paracoccus aurantiacus]|uniref:Nucleotide-diphospho-sugar transferase domain-containing protein n=1 Tax=Paracoccus aurantiacus TaxID=2599412 RepID=A0A5C6S8N6_9RHOB|nr:hypothetical protein [Paracoccus aurantiacus]TXB70452.1 hypothetical protein FQV27_00825 [Paracoccus aurantiacus]
MMNRSLSIIFIVDGERLQAQSLLLVSSLYRQLADTPATELVAYAPERAFGKLSPATQALFDLCGVRVCQLRDADGMWKKDYPHGNKLLAAAECRDSEATLFLDTDMVCLRPFPELDFERAGTVFAVPEGVPTWGEQNDRWRRAYAHYGMDLPTDRVTLTRGAQRSYYPYFNAGFVGFANSAVHDGKHFGQLWLETASDFDWNCSIAQKRPWLDQITMPLTIKRFGLEYEALPDVYNYSISNREDMSGTEDARILHYHRAMFLERAPQYPTLRDDLFALMPREHHAEMSRLLTLANYPLPSG